MMNEEQRPLFVPQMEGQLCLDDQPKRIPANKSAAVRALFTDGALMECVANTYIPDRAGYRVRIERAGKTVALARGLDGKAFRCSMPTRVGDVLAVDDRE